MTWIPGVLRGPAAEAARPVPSRQDIERLRQAVAQAGTDAERTARERELGSALAESAAAPSEADSETVAAAAACHASDKEQARRWMARLRGEPHFAEVALHARYADLRYAAVQRVTEPELLEQVAAATRERDKRVHRYCADILDARKSHAERAQRADALLAELSAALDEPPPLAAARLAQLDRGVQALGECAEAAQCGERLARLHARARAEAESLRDLHRTASRADALAKETAAQAWPISDRLEGWRAGLAALNESLAGLPAWTSNVATARVLHETLAAIGARVGELARDADLYAACERFLAAPEGGCDAEAWEALEKPRNAAAREALHGEWTRRSSLAKPPPQATEEAARKPKPRLDLEAIQAALMAMERSLAEGHLAEAERAEARLERSIGEARLPGGLDARCKRAKAELARLRGWARWGNVHAHDQLIAEAERLLAEPGDVEALAQAVGRLRSEWKRLDATGAGSRAQWERFDAIVERVYRPVAEHRAAQAAEQRAAQAARVALLDEWEAWFRSVDWSSPDWRAVERRRADMLGKWHAGKRTGFRDERALRKRFDPLMAQIDARLAQARDAEAARREALVEQAESLREAADLGGATARARALQADWRDAANGVHLGRGKEEALWKRFRAACDAVFARRDAERSERAAQAEQATQGRKALLEALEKDLSASSVGEIEAALTRFRGAWRAGPRAARDTAGGLEAQAARLARRAAERIDELRRGRRAARYTVLAQKSALASRVEAAAASGGAVDEALAQAREAWATLAALDADAERALKARLDAAPSATAAALAEGLEARAGLLLDLELALGLSTPPAHAAARRMRQLARLQERFSAAARESSPEQLVARWYATAAAEDPEHGARMAAVVSALSATR